MNPGRQDESTKLWWDPTIRYFIVGTKCLNGQCCCCFPDFNSGQQYPLLVYVYGGPGFQAVDDKWNQYDYETYLAGSQEIVYAMIDPKGSGFQGTDWMFSVYKNFGGPEVSSTIEVTKYLQNNLNYIDSKKTAIWGWSYGGFLSLSVLAQEVDGVFKCAASVAPVVDWRLYDTYYTVSNIVCTIVWFRLNRWVPSWKDL